MIELLSEDPANEYVWVWWEGREPRIGFTKPLPRHSAVKYMRVLTRQEVEKIAGEGVDVQQYINSLLRTVNGQRTHIAKLEKTIERYSEAMEDDGNV